MSNHPNRSKSIRPREHLRAAGKLYPSAWKQVDVFREGRGKDLPDWPKWCFLPMAAAYSIVSAESGLQRLPLDLAGDVSRIAALATWRVTQGVYRFDAALFPKIWDTPVSGDVPVDILYRLPEWCVYVETPDQEQMKGFFAHLEYDINHQRPELRLLIDADVLIPVPLHIGNQSLQECVNRAIDQSKTQASTLGAVIPDGLSVGIKNLIEPCVSLLLYLCSQGAEIDGIGRPSNPRPKKAKGKWRMFPADKPKTWDVGVRLGSALRRAYQQHETGDEHQEGNAKRPHIRRAHWHTYWTGSGDEKKPLLKWLPPISVNLNGDELPVVIRSVEGDQ